MLIVADLYNVQCIDFLTLNCSYELKTMFDYGSDGIEICIHIILIKTLLVLALGIVVQQPSIVVIHPPSPPILLLFPPLSLPRPHSLPHQATGSHPKFIRHSIGIMGSVPLVVRVRIKRLNLRLIERSKCFIMTCLHTGAFNETTLIA